MKKDEPIFLTFDNALLIHEDQIRRYGGSPGIRDEGLLHSALAQPNAGFESIYLHDNIPSQTSAYLFHIVKNHPFIDGNKRTGLACSLIFLDINGFNLSEELDILNLKTKKTPLEEIVLKVASGKMSKEELISFLKNYISEK